MSTIVFAWELGGDYGHITRLLPLALRLREQGHRPVFVIRELIHAEALLQAHGIEALQAPMWTGRMTQLPSPLSYPELLMAFGFLHAAGLTALCRAWRHLLTLLNADLLILDHAPTALLASRGLGLPRLHLGDGFTLPPAPSPLPAFAWWQSSSEAGLQRRMASEQQVLAQVNQVLASFGEPQLRQLGELFEVEAQALCSFPELDPYPADLRPPGSPWLGPLFMDQLGQPPQWPEEEEEAAAMAEPGPSAPRQARRPRLFAYLKPAYGPIEQVLQALHQVPASVLVHLPGAAKKTVQTHSHGRVRICGEALAMAQVSAECDLALCHGGAGTSALMLLAGKPLALLPMQTEQWMSAQRLQTLGVAAGLLIDDAGRLPQLLQHVLAEPRYRQAAQAFAQAHHGYRQADALAALLAQCQALLARPRNGKTHVGAGP